MPIFQISFSPENGLKGSCAYWSKTDQSGKFSHIELIKQTIIKDYSKFFFFNLIYSLFSHRKRKKKKEKRKVLFSSRAANDQNSRAAHQIREVEDIFGQSESISYSSSSFFIDFSFFCTNIYSLSKF